MSGAGRLCDRGVCDVLRTYEQAVALCFHSHLILWTFIVGEKTEIVCFFEVLACLLAYSVLLALFMLVLFDMIQHRNIRMDRTNKL